MLHVAVRNLDEKLQLDGPNESAAYLAQMQEVHEKLLKAIADMADATQPGTPDPEKFTYARWRLSKASRARRVLWEQVRGYIAGRASGGERDAIDRLVADNEELRRSGTAHIGRWSSQAIVQNWEDYCDASRSVRWEIMSVVRHERRNIMPILERLSSA
jgi:hypothetical protein